MVADDDERTEPTGCPTDGTSTSLRAIRSRIEARAVSNGEYNVVCARTGEHPVPISGLTFPDRETAARAARTARRYRARLRRYDPRVAYHDLIVCEVGGHIRDQEGRADDVGTRSDWWHQFWAVADSELARFRTTRDD